MYEAEWLVSNPSLSKQLASKGPPVWVERVSGGSQSTGAGSDAEQDDEEESVHAGGLGFCSTGKNATGLCLSLISSHQLNAVPHQFNFLF